MPDVQESSPPATPPSRIDTIMEQASRALAQTKAIECETSCLRAMELAVADSDWDRAARIVLPLLEARRLRRQVATDSGTVRVVDTPAQARMRAEGVCFLFQPPLVAADARAFREAHLKKGVPLFVLTREPMTRDGLWPVSAVGAAEDLTLRVRIQPPPGVEPRTSGVTRDEITRQIPVSWFEAAAEALGDAAIASVNPKEPAAHRVLDLIDRLSALPEHEKLHQALERACQEALLEPPPKLPRRRGREDAFSF